MLGSWSVEYRGGDAGGGLTVSVEDQTGTVTNAVQGQFPGDMGSMAFREGVVQGSDARTLVAYWWGGMCDQRARLTLEANGTTLRLHLPPPGTPCRLAAVGRAIELWFRDPTEASSISLTITRDVIATSDVHAQSTAWFGTDEGFVGGTTDYGEAVVLHTRNGGSSWAVEGLGIGDVSALVVASGTGGRVWAITTCDSCWYALLQSDGSGTWTEMDGQAPEAISFLDAGTGVGLFPDPRLTDDGGLTWTPVATQVTCPSRAPVAASIARLRPSTIVILCQWWLGSGNERKVLLRSTDDGAHWGAPEPLAMGGEQATMGIAPDGTGYLASRKAPMQLTTDGGLTWTEAAAAPPLVGGFVVAAAALEGGTVMVLVGDDTSVQQLFRVEDGGATWTSVASFQVPCCGG
ncbi:MAG: sialidase family protein [Chloroflexota bacterium]